MKPALTLESVLRPRPTAAGSALGEEMVLLDTSTGSYFGLNPVGSAIWEGLVQGEPLAGIVAALSRRFDVDRETCERDVLRLAGELVERGLATLEAGPPDRAP